MSNQVPLVSITSTRWHLRHLRDCTAPAKTTGMWSNSWLQGSLMINPLSPPGASRLKAAARTGFATSDSILLFVKAVARRHAAVV